MAIPDVQINFLVKGIPDVQRAFRSLQTTFEQSERLQTRSADTGARARLKAASAEAKAKEKAFAHVAQEADRWQRQMVKDHERAAKAQTKATENAAKDKIRAYRSADREVSRALTASVREHERAEAQKSRDAMRWVRTREAEERASFARRSKFAGAVVGAAKTAGRTVVGGAQRVASTLLQVGGGFSVADAIKEQGDLERSAVGLSNSAYMGKGPRMDAKALQAQAKAASIRTGIDANEILKGAHAFGAKTGRYDEGVSQMDFFGQVSKGTGASVEDVAKTAGVLRVQNKDLKPEQMKALLLQTIRQGQQGSVEFEDLAKVAGRVTRSSVNYAGNQEANQGKLLGLAQIAMRTSGSPEEAATVLSNVSADAMKHHDKFKAGTFNKQGQIAKAPEEFLADVMEQTGGNLQKIQGMGFGMRSMKMFQAMAPTFNKARAEGKSGRDAVLGDIKDVTAGTMPVDELQTNVKNILNTSAEQFEAGVRQLKTAVGEQLMPEFVKLVPVLQQLIPYLQRFLEGVVKVADWALANPLAGLGAAITALIVKELAAAQIAKTIQSLISGGSAPGVGGAGAGGAGVIVAGAAAQTYGVYSTVKGGLAAGAAGDKAGAEAFAKGDTAAVDAARAKSGGGDVAAAYLDKVRTIGVAAINPFAAVGQLAGDAALGAAGIKTNDQRSNETLQANATAKKFDELAAASTAATQALKSLAAGGGSLGGGGSTDTSNRSQNIAQRTSK